MNRRRFLQTAAAAGSVSYWPAAAQTGLDSTMDLRHATVVVRGRTAPLAEKTAALVLVEEIARRTGIALRTSTSWPERGPVIALTSTAAVPEWGRSVPVSPRSSRPEGYRLLASDQAPSPVVWVIGSDPRGVLFGVGRLLRELNWSRGTLELARAIDVTTAPAYSIRGHQLGYRAQANSYDAWSVEQFEQYIRELTFFGVNSIEGIPFQDERKTPVMKVPRREMNRAIGEICHRYGLDYWLWVPAEFDLRQTAPRTRLLERCEELFRDCPSVSGIFFPGGDPGQNPPELVLPFLEDVSRRLLPIHQEARIWLSLQWFTPAQIDFVYEYLERESPPWFGGLIAGPSGPPAAATRQRLAAKYRLRLYPDITHNKLCQYQVPEWDQAYALTLGREAINPRPAEYARIHNRWAAYSDGFISYSDGVHDDVNKTVWSALSWDPETPVRDILIDYARVYFQPSIAEETSDAILALEKNWRGPLIDNGAVESTLRSWRELERKAPELSGNWRWQMCLLRANYDAYVRRRLFRERRLEKEANRAILQAADSTSAIAAATSILHRAVERPTSPDLRARIAELCERLFHSIGLQTSVSKYYAIGEERGAILDFVDYPLNNRWWLEDEFQKVRGMASEPEKRQRLRELATWEDPGSGGFYDVVGDISRSPHVVRGQPDPTEPDSPKNPEPTFWWWDQGHSRARLSWQVTMWPVAMLYEGLSEQGKYVVRTTGFGQCRLRINGELIAPVVDGKQMGEFKEFPVPPQFLTQRRLVLTWDPPKNEEHLNWRNRSRLAEVWLLKKG
jgi:hypothetical protein